MRYDKEQIDQWLTEWEQTGKSISNTVMWKPLTRAHFTIGVARKGNLLVINERP
ncbi:MAG: hypothetical protein IPO37_14020 [Saprospiraceae bacterium]|nr:hypothetical protein [Saprospiraceae bacterium]